MTIPEMRADLGLDDSYSDLQVVNLWALRHGDPASLQPVVVEVAAVVAPIDPNAAALDAIEAAFADIEPLIYTQRGVILPPFRAVRSDHGAPAFEGSGSSARTVTYEVRKRNLPYRPVTKETFAHRGRRWRVGDVTPRDDVDAWELVVSDMGAIA